MISLLIVQVLIQFFRFHPNLFPIWNELIDPTESRVNLMVNLAQGTNTFIYVIVALFGYLSFLDETEGIPNPTITSLFHFSSL